ncbi:MAG: hypothetical protein ACRC1H_20195 [Caldilineaceae bacterium]
MSDPSRPAPAATLSSAQRAAMAAGVGSVIARLRLRAATIPLPALPANNMELLEAWLHSLPLPTDDAPGEPLSALGLHVTGDLQRLTWFAAGDPATVIPPMAEYLQSVNTSTEELDRLSAAGAAVEPVVLGSFFESRSDGVNAGWFFPGRAGFRLAMGQVDHPPFRDALLRWAADFPDAEVLSIGRAMGAGAPYTRLTVTLPQSVVGDLSEALPAAMALFDALEAPLPPDEALAELQVQPPTALGASFWMDADGLLKAGLVAWEPSLSLMIALADTAGVTGSLDALASLQALLDVTDASAVELQTRADGYGIELMYELL